MLEDTNSLDGAHIHVHALFLADTIVLDAHYDIEGTRYIVNHILTCAFRIFSHTDDTYMFWWLKDDNIKLIRHLKIF